MDHRFACTQCGRCCRDLRLTLSVAEAIVWTTRGHPVQLLCEAMPWPEQTAASDASGAPPHVDADPGRRYRAERAFAAHSGEIPLRISVTLAAWNDGPCPHLQPDQRCGIYAERPRICRIYPLESRPWFKLDPAHKLCPPEAWGVANPLLMTQERVVEPGGADLIAAHRAEEITDVAVKAAACRTLGIVTAGFAGEGAAIHTPNPASLAAALADAAFQLGDEPPSLDEWTIVSNQRASVALLASYGCRSDFLADGSRYFGSAPTQT